MNAVKIKKFIFDIAWIVIIVCIAIFFTVAVCVYAKAEPSGTSELLSYDESWHSASELSAMAGDLEAYPYVTKVYEYATDNESVNICWVNDESVLREKIDYGVVADEHAEHNYCVECFVYSDIADKQLVKRTWGISVTEGDVLTFAETKEPYFYRYCQEIGDIKKGSYNKNHGYITRYSTFIRITVKPEFDDIEVEVRNK